MKKLLVGVVCTLLLVIYSGNVKADEFSDAMLDAKADLKEAMNTADKSQIVKVRGQFERILQLQKDVWLVNYYIALCDYMIGVSEMVSQEPGAVGKMKEYNEAGLERINDVISQKSDFSDAYVLKMFLNFSRWTYEQEQMNDIIDVDMQTDPKAKQYDENNPRYYLVKGIAAYWTPAAFGGGEDKAIELLDKSDVLFETTKPANEIYPDWGHEWAIGYNVLTLIKRGEDGDMDKAKQILDDGMKTYPDSGFLKGYIQEEYNKALASPESK